MSYDPVANPSVPNFEDEELHPPAGFRDTAGSRQSYGAPSNVSFDSAAPIGPAAQYPYRDEPSPAPGAHEAAFLDKEQYTNNEQYNNAGYPPAGSPPLGYGATQKKRRKLPWIIGGIAALALLIVAVIVPVYFKVIKKDSNSAATSNSGGSPSSGGSGSGGSNPAGIVYGDAVTGGSGSTITTEDGSTFTYTTTFGGMWYADPKDPYNYNAYPQSWTKPLNQSWDFQNDVIRGVNLGGWLVPEPFIAPALFEKYQNTSIPAIDEWTLSINMAADTANGGLNQLEDHYKTFITEEDFARIAAAGLNWVRLPFPYWAIQTYEGEPFLEGVAWKYALKAFAWARKYGLRVNLDLHGLPGSQNGYNHSGKWGQVDFLNGVMGLANAQRGLDYMRIIVEFITQPEYANLIPYFGVMNEPKVKVMGMDVMGSFYLHMHDVLRNITGLGQGHGPVLSIHDGFNPLSSWADFLPGNDRIAMDTHPYLCFTNPDPSPLSEQLMKPCNAWAKSLNASRSAFGITTAGEWSLAINDCGLWVNGVNAGTRWEGTLGSYSGPTGNDPNGCSDWNNWQSWDQDTKDNFKQFALATMDALQQWFFWTWRIGNSSVTGTVEAPFWSYSLGLEQGWMPTDPRQSVGVCGGGSPASPLKATATGGPGAGDFSSDVRSSNPWPPTTLAPGGWPGTALPTYTATGPIPTLPMPTFASATTPTTDKGWFNAADTAPIFTPIAGCSYPDAWNAANITDLPPACPASGTTRRRSFRNVVPAFPEATAPPS